MFKITRVWLWVTMLFTSNKSNQFSMMTSSNGEKIVHKGSKTSQSQTDIKENHNINEKKMRNSHNQ